MKVLTIRESFATLIRNKVKYIETRSWEVKERKGLSELYSDDELNYGYIICKCN